MLKEPKQEYIDFDGFLLKDNHLEDIGKDAVITFISNCLEQDVINLGDLVDFLEANQDPVQEIVLPDATGKYKFYSYSGLAKDILEDFVVSPTREEAKFLVDTFYQYQKRRIAMDGQIRAILKGQDKVIKNKNHSNEMFMEYLDIKLREFEKNIERALNVYSGNFYLGKYSRSILGIGPVLAAGLAATFEIKDNGNNDTNMKAGNWWSYAGLNDNNRPWLGRERSTQIVDQVIKNHNMILDDDTVAEIAFLTRWKFNYLKNAAYDQKKKKWDRGKLKAACAKIPWNADAKCLMWKCGEQFFKLKSNPKSVYAKILRERIDYETPKNENREYAELAAKRFVDCKKKGKAKKSTLDTYESGRLPMSHIYSRAKRYSEKIFLGHLFEAEYYNMFGSPAPDPYILSMGNHTDYIYPEVPYASIDRDYK